MELAEKLEWNPAQAMLSDPQAVHDQVVEYAHLEKREVVSVFLLDSRNVAFRAVIVSVGTLGQALLSPREVFREAVREGAAHVILAHTHPGGLPEPSPEDFTVTKQLGQAGDLLGVDLLDHVIVGPEGRYHSMREHGQLQ